MTESKSNRFLRYFSLLPDALRSKDQTPMWPVPEPEVLRILGEESRRKGTSAMTSRRIDQVIKAARAGKSKRR